MTEQNHITITLPDGGRRTYPRGVTGAEIARDLGRKLGEEALAVFVNGILRDLNRPLTEDASVQFVTFADEKGKEIYWHSTSHLMAHAVETLWPGARFGVGPAIEQGFYYDIDVDHTITPEDLATIENRMRELSQADTSFERRELSKDEALAFFKEKGDPYKVEIIEGLDDNVDTISLYTEGSFTDLCRGPHVPSTGKIKHVKLLSVSGSYWKGDASNKRLQRIYGISFPKKSDLDDFLRLLEEARKRDHRKLGRELELFTFHDIAPGAPFWLPRGMIIFRELERLIREMLDAAGYEEILTPILVKKDLWEQSGHWEHYQENMFLVEVEKEIYSLKPMNCPESTLVYRQKVRSYRDLPLRYSEIGRNHRNELSGVLNGMFRVRQFHMDDAHLYVRPDQILSEITALLQLVNRFYAIFDFRPTFGLATRPEHAMGDPELWTLAEEGLRQALEANEIPYTLHPGDGAFYGPKIDITIHDALHRSWQLATIQLDFQMPERFQLEYIDEHNERRRPVMIHRAIMGSLERFVGVLVEHYGGAFPVWLAPVQSVVLPISDQHIAYAVEVKDTLRSSGIRCELDARNEKIGHKIRDWEMQKVPFMLVVGEKERQAKTVSVRKRREGDIGSFPLDEYKAMIKGMIERKEA